MKRRLAMAGVAAAAAAVGAGVSLWRLRTGEADLPADFWSLRFDRPEGGQLALAPLKGRPLLINFWATWCAPCIREMPLLDRFQQDQAAAGWQVIGLAVDGSAAVRDFLLKRPLRYPIGLAGLDGVDLARTLGNGAGGLPFSVLVDRAGRARERKLGALHESDLVGWASIS